VREIRDGSRANFRAKEFAPTLLVPTSNTHTEFHDERGNNLEKLEIDSVADAKEFIDQYKDVSGFQIYGSSNWTSQYITDKYPGEFAYDVTKIRLFNFDIEVASDEGFPYPEDAKYPVISIALHDSMTDRYYVWAVGEYDNQREDVNYHGFQTEAGMLRAFLDFWNKECPDVITGWNIAMFDIPYLVNRIEIVLGAAEVKRLSPWGMVNNKNIRDNYGRDHQSYEFVGISTLDYLDLYKKYTYSAQESYSLDHIAYVELKERKLDYSEAGTLHSLYKTDFQKFIDYNIKDVELVKRIDEKMLLLYLVYTIAFMTHQNFTDTFSPVRTWEALIYNWFYDQSIFTKVKNVSGNKKVQIAGAYVKEIDPSVHDWIISCDLNSLYPHLIMQYNLGPDTLDEELTCSVESYIEQYLSHPDKASKDAQNARRLTPYVEGTADTSELVEMERCMAANETYYRKDHQSMFSCLMEMLYADRKKTKKLMLAKQQEKENTKDPAKRAELTKEIAALNNKQLAYKILMNSGYGAIANAYFQFFDPRVAEAVTLSGQLSIKWIQARINKYLNKIIGTGNVDYVIYCDTDSVYVNLNDIVQVAFGERAKDPANHTKIVDFLDQVVKEKIQPVITKGYEELAEYMHSYRNAMVMEREVIASRGFWTAKKRYALMVYDSEGVRYAEPKPKIMGLEVVKSSTPEFCRNKLKDAIKLVLTGDNNHVLDFIEKTRGEFTRLDPADVAFPRSVAGLRKYGVNDDSRYRTGTPRHVKGALNYNYLLKKSGNKVDAPIQEGEKIKFLTLKQPNPLHDNIIAFPSHTTLPPEFELAKYVDYDEQFDKAFFQPLRAILDAVGWKSENTVSLEDFFG